MTDWSTNTPWFDVALVQALFAVGAVLFGHFEQHKSRARRLAKVAIVTAVYVALAATVGRPIALLVLAVPLVGAVYLHVWWLPKNGVNGWTGEPQERYRELLKKHGKH